MSLTRDAMPSVVRATSYSGRWSKAPQPGIAGGAMKLAQFEMTPTTLPSSHRPGGQGRGGTPRGMGRGWDTRRYRPVLSDCRTLAGVAASPPGPRYRMADS